MEKAKPVEISDLELRGHYVNIAKAFKAIMVTADLTHEQNNRVMDSLTSDEQKMINIIFNIIQQGAKQFAIQKAINTALKEFE